MSGSGRQAEERTDGRQEPIAAGWLAFVAFLLSPIFAILAKLLARGLGVADAANLSLVAIILALLMIPMTAPRSAKQLGLVVTIVAAGGTLGILLALATASLGWGIWGSILGGGLAAGLGAGFIILCYRHLKVELRRFSENGQT